MFFYKMTIDQHTDLLCWAIEQSGYDIFEIYPLHQYRSNRRIGNGLTKNEIHGLLFKLGLLFFRKGKNEVSVKAHFESLSSLVNTRSTDLNVEVNQKFDSTRNRSYFIVVKKSAKDW